MNCDGAHCPLEPAKVQGVRNSRALHDPNGGTNGPFGILSTAGGRWANPGDTGRARGLAAPTSARGTYAAAASSASFLRA